MWPRVKQQVLGLWQTLRLPSRHYSLGFLTVAGFIAGILFWGGFNTALEATNTEAFCTSCHEMQDNVFEELKTTIHYSNRSGVRVRKRLNAVESLQRKKQICPYCEKPGVRRQAVGIWTCFKCGKTFAGHAYSLKRQV